MNPEQQRIKIAEACGWKLLHSVHEAESLGGIKSRAVYHVSLLPDYLNDLNAMHEAEKIFDVNVKSGDSLRYVYSDHLYKIVPNNIQPCRANAAQRAEAFLKTLNLWEESK